MDYMQERSFNSKTNFVELVSYRLNECDALLEKAGNVIKVIQKIQWHKMYLLSKIDILSKEYGDLLSQEIRRLEATTTEIEQRSQ